jgi:hypothetical protein
MKQNTEKQYTEKDIIINICRRLNILIEEFSTERSIEVAAYYDIGFVFDDDGNVIKIDSHP